MSTLTSLPESTSAAAPETDIRSAGEIRPLLPEPSTSKPARTEVGYDRRIPVLDGLRGLAVLWVMVFHFWLFGTTTGKMLWERVYAGAAGMGWAGVDLFFVLSGFLITGILYDARGTQHYFRVFYARRTVRIFPLYYASLALFFVIIPFALAHLRHPDFADVHTSSSAQFFAWAYMVNWYEGLKGWSVVPAPLQHFWSLAVEEQFYLIWPLLVLTVPRRRLMAVCAGMMAFGLGLRILLYGIHLPYAAYTWTFSRADSLAIGAIVALAARDAGDWKKLLRWAPSLAALACVGVIVLRLFSPLATAGPGSTPTFLMGTIAITLLGIFFGGCLTMAVCSRPESPVHRVLGSSFLRFFGKYSYCLYVCHAPLIIFFAKVGLNADHFTELLHNKFLAVVGVNFVAFAFTIAIALASWNLFEKQWLKLKDLPSLRREDPPAGTVESESWNLDFVQRPSTSH